MALAAREDPGLGGVRVLRRPLGVPALQVLHRKTAVVAQPAIPPDGTPVGPSGPRADFWYRLGGFLIDAVILGIVGQIIGFVFQRNVVAVILIGLAVGIGYSVYFIGSGSGQTIGMRVLGIRAIDAATSGRVDYGKAFIRY